MTSGTDLPAPSIGHLLEKAAQLYGERPFLLFAGKIRSFAQVNAAANQIANALQDLGLTKGERVAVMLPNGFEFPNIWLALAKCGLVMVPINTSYKAADLTYVLQDSGAAAFIFHVDYGAVFQRIQEELNGVRHRLTVGGTVPGSVELSALTEMARPTFTIANISDGDLLNIQYTSGTTGFPKGCMLTHRYWLQLGRVAADYFQNTPNDRDLTAQPFTYMDPQWNVIACLIGGSSLVIMRRFSASRFWSTVKENGVTFFYLLSAMPLFLLKQPPDPEVERGHQVRLILCSGIPRAFHAELEARWGVPWREAFGMTETGVDLLVPAANENSVGSGVMGRPIQGKEVRVVEPHDGTHTPLPHGRVGEMVVRGEPMMLGYWGKPEMTAQTIQNGWLHTGDLVRQDEQGYFTIVGRIKDMVRRSGENIAASEVEQVLVQHPGVRAAAVVPVPDELRGEEVKAYIVLQKGESPQSITPELLLAFAAEKLAAFKLPRYFTYLEKLPLTPSEKIAKQQLISGTADLRRGSYDRITKEWIPDHAH
jgi:acyl-CoA synthetase (AMP-forming)/AMP-acid ligase II